MHHPAAAYPEPQTLSPKHSPAATLFASPLLQLTLAEFTAALERFGQLDNEEEQYKCKPAVRIACVHSDLYG